MITCARRLTSAGVIRDVFGINRHPCDRNRAPIASGTARPGEAGASEASLSEAPVFGGGAPIASGTARPGMRAPDIIRHGREASVGS